MAPNINFFRAGDPSSLFADPFFVLSVGEDGPQVGWQC